MTPIVLALLVLQAQVLIGRMPDQMHLRLVPAVPVRTDGTHPQLAVIRIGPGHHEPLKPCALPAVHHRIDPQRPPRRAAGHSIAHTPKLKGHTDIAPAAVGT
jgi:hypothetical protein